MSDKDYLSPQYVLQRIYEGFKLRFDETTSHDFGIQMHYAESDKSGLIEFEIMGKKNNILINQVGKKSLYHYEHTLGDYDSDKENLETLAEGNIKPSRSKTGRISNQESKNIAMMFLKNLR